MISNEAFQQTPTYEHLCRDYKLDPALPPESQLLPLGQAREFLCTYDELRRAMTPRTAIEVAGGIEVALRRAQAAPEAALPAGQAALAAAAGPLAVIARHGPVIVVQSDDGLAWQAAIAPAVTATVTAAWAATLSETVNAWPS